MPQNYMYIMVNEDDFINFVKWYGNTHKKENKSRVFSIYDKNNRLIAVQDYDATYRPLYYICVYKNNDSLALCNNYSIETIQCPECKKWISKEVKIQKREG